MIVSQKCHEENIDSAHTALRMRKRN